MRYRLLFAVAALVASADALTKTAAVALSHWMPIRLPGGWTLQVAHNSGGFLGVGTGTALPHVFGIVAAVQFAVLLWACRRYRSRVRAVALGLALGGAAANLGEYQMFGSVVDWIRPPHPDIVFDLADVAVAAGQVLLIALLARDLLRVRTAAAVTR